MSRLAHVSESGSARSLRASPNNVDAGDSWTINLEPCLNARLHHLSSEQNSCIDAPSAKLKKYARERFPLLGSDHEHITRLRAVGLVARKQTSSGASRVKRRDLCLA